MASSSTETLFDRLRAEYLEMPGMSLTLDQVVRLCGIERSACQGMLDGLVESEFLSVKDGVYTRRSDDAGHARMAQAQLQDYVAPRVTRRAS